MSIARHHAEWLSLIETSGPFLSMPVLLRVFPQGLEPRNAAKSSRLREAYEDWMERGAKQPAVHHAWIRHVLAELLEYPPEFLVEGQGIPPGMEAVMANFGETLRPDFVLKHRDTARKPLLLIEHYAPEQDLAKPVAGRTWKASPGTRMMELLHATDVPLGLVTNGEQWMLVSAPRGETTGFASWYADLWMQEPVTLRAFHSLLHLRRFLGVAEPETLAALYAESAKDQQEVTDQLGYQVRRAVEMLVQAFDRMDAESGRALLAGVREKDLYDSALTIMMRLVFLFSAEERGLLLLGDPLYDQHYAVSTLSELLRERADQQGEEVLERRQDAWCRLLATFRAVHAGVEHEAMRLPPYGGTLFDPDRYPFLEGRAAETRWQTTPSQPFPINNRVVLHLLEALQVLRVKVPGGGPAEARRISFRALDIEQIGHVYEGLLDHTAKRAHEVILGLAGSKKSEPEIPLAKLEELAARDKTAFIEFLKEETGRSVKALGKDLEKPELVGEHALLVACNQDPLLAKRIRPFAALLREDDFGRLVVISAGSVYVTAGNDRRSTGTHYTPRSLTEPIVLHTLEPLVYVGPAEGKPPAEWVLKSPRELLALKVCDMTMGSGAFLVQTCRYLAERLVESWELAEKSQPGGFIKTPEGDLAVGEPSERLLPADPGECLILARRYIADRCLYGVDINPMAVEMAKLSLWLITLQRDRPFTFLDHALKCGDSLLGVSSVLQIENFSLRPGDRQVTFATANLFRYVEEASAKRRALEDLPSNDYSQIETKNRLHAEAEAATAKLKALADVLIAFELRGLDGEKYGEQRTAEAEAVQSLMQRDAGAGMAISNPKSVLAHFALESLRERRPFHWAVEFPEVFGQGGFGAFVGNPPFMGGLKLFTELGGDYRKYIILHLANGVAGVRGTADLCAYFFLRTIKLVRSNGNCGLLATNTVSQGDTREAGLDQIVAGGATIYRAVQSERWPGTASLEVSHVWIRNGSWKSASILDEMPVAGITNQLSASGSVLGQPHPLRANEKQAFQGSNVFGLGFCVSPQEAQDLIARAPDNRRVLFPYVDGDDFNTHPRHLARRWIINFFDWPLDKDHDDKRNPIGPPYAREFRDCLEIVEARVKPERVSLPPINHFNKAAARRWWHYGGPRVSLYAAAKRVRRVLVTARVSPTNAVAWQAPNVVFHEKLVCFPRDEQWFFSVMQSWLHWEWARLYTSTLGATTLNYSPSACFETFPFPLPTKQLGDVGTEYNDARQVIMLARQEGLTKIYNRFHNPNEISKDIALLRALHMEMDQAVALAYGWPILVGGEVIHPAPPPDSRSALPATPAPLDLGHGFQETKQGIRFTISESARRIVLDRLLALNHQRYAEEVAAGLHEKKRGAGGGGRGGARKETGGIASQGELIEPPQEELL